MFKSIGRAVVRHPWWTIGIWVVVGAALVALAPTVKPSSDQSDFLPDKYEAVQAVELQEKAFPQANGETALVVVTRKDGGKLTDEQQQKVEALATKLHDAKLKHVTEVAPQMVSPNGKVQTLNVQFNTKDFEKLEHPVEQIRDEIKDNKIPELNARLTGNAATTTDSTKAVEEGDKITFLATIVVIFVLLLITFRSIVAALMPIFTVMLVMVVAGSIINIVIKLFDLKGDQTTTSMLPIVLFGVGTDYILFLLFRYRERLRMGEDKKLAMANSVHKVGEVIASAAGAVIIAFTALVLAQLSFLRVMGPSMAIAVGTALVASLTLIPAIVSLIGPKIFWPSKSWKAEPKHTISHKIGRSLARRPGVFAIGSLVVLVGLGIGMFSYSPSYDMAPAPKGTESATGIEDMRKGFPPGALDATQILVRSTNGQAVTDADVAEVKSTLEKTDGVGSVRDFDAETGLSKDKTVAMLELELANQPTSDKAMDDVRNIIRPAAHAAAPEGTQVLVGGITSVFVDLNSSMNRDYTVVFPVAGVLIAIILAFLLRSLVSPLYLIVAVVLTFAATIGGSVFYFTDVKDHSGLLFFMPLVVYLFVVALGTDYNILTIARLREEAQAGNPPQQAAENAFVKVAPVVASAGLILAGSFATFLLAKAEVMQEMGTSVAMGIALAAFVMSLFLVPAITRLLGHKAWWPGHGDMPKHGEAVRPKEELVGAAARE